MEKSEYEQMYRLEDRHWYFAGKRDLVVSLLAGELSGRNSLVLDAGCGTGRTLADLMHRYTVVGMEPFAGALSFALQRKGTSLVQGDLEQTPFRSGAFDAVTALDVLEHCDDDRHALSEISRVLTAGGVLLVTVPAYMWLWSAHDEALHHRRRYSRTELMRLLDSCGFSISKISYFNVFVFPLVAVARLLSNYLTRDRGRSDTNKLPAAAVNGLLYGLQCVERAVIKVGSFPFGVSLVCVARKR
jgi:ubiquinone/menaquinone biosynthesis C-methylase UbiE